MGCVYFDHSLVLVLCCFLACTYSKPFDITSTLLNLMNGTDNYLLELEEHTKLKEVNDVTPWY